MLHIAHIANPYQMKGDMNILFGIQLSIVKSALDTYIDALNKALSTIISLLTKSSWITDITSSSQVTPIIDAIKGIALTLCALFFLMDFFSKTMNLQWVKWENILMFFIKMVFAKILIDKAPDICEMIYSGFNSVINTAYGGIGAPKIFPDDWTQEQKYIAFGLSSDEASKLLGTTALGIFDLSPLLINTKVNVMMFLYIVILAICFVIVLGRLFELVVYTIIAPVPLATFCSDGLHDIGKGFLKSYTAVSIQALVLIIMFIAYSAITNEITAILNSSSGLYAFGGLINLLALALGVMQSGNWAKRICGAI